MLSSNTISCIPIFRLYFNRTGNKRSKTQQMPKMSTAFLVLRWNKHPKSNIEFQKSRHPVQNSLDIFECIFWEFLYVIYCFGDDMFTIYDKKRLISAAFICAVFFFSFISLVECCESQLCTENAKMVAHRI